MTRLAHARIERAVRAAERGTTGHIVVRIVPEKSLDAFDRARQEFEQAGLHTARARNASMILVAPVARKYAVLGDKALHERVGDAFWKSLVDEMRPYFASDRSVEAIVFAIDRIGTELHRHFPAAT